MTPNIRTKLILPMPSGKQWYWRSRTIRRTYTSTANPSQRKALKNINCTQWIAWTIQTFANRKEFMSILSNQGCLCNLIFRFLLVRRLISLCKPKDGGKYSKFFDFSTTSFNFFLSTLFPIFQAVNVWPWLNISSISCNDRLTVSGYMK